jgi:NAD-dependent deacetylase
LTIYQNIAVLTGAGISAESGLSTFRGADGLWEQHRLEDVATPEAFRRDPELVHRFYNMRRANLGTVQPNSAHEALARLEREHDGEVLVVTQNVDDLHERGGSRNVLHMHGELLKVRCRSCAVVLEWSAEIDETVECPTCGIVPSLRPHIVWFGEMPFCMYEIDEALRACDLFISIGTSGNVYPAAGFVAQVRALGRARSVELNLEPSEGVSLFDEVRHGPASKLVPEFVEQLLTTEV